MGFIAVGDKVIAETNPDLTGYALAQDVADEFENVVYKTDIDKTITADSTDDQVASAKAVFTSLALKPEIDDEDSESETTVWSAKKVHDELETINDSLVDLDEKKADADKVVNFEYIRDNSSADAKALIEKHWSEHENFKFYNLHLDTSKWAWSAEIYFHTSEYGTVILRSYGNDASNIWYGKVYGGVWTWQELATMDKVQKGLAYTINSFTCPANSQQVLIQDITTIGVNWSVGWSAFIMNRNGFVNFNLFGDGNTLYLRNNQSSEVTGKIVLYFNYT